MIWLGVAAFVLVVLQLAGVGVGVAVGLRAWRQIAPQVRPILSMFTPATPPPSAEVAARATTATTTPYECPHPPSTRHVDPVSGVERCVSCGEEFGLFDPLAAPRFVPPVIPPPKDW